MTALNPQDAEQLATLKVLADSAGNDLEAACEKASEANRALISARALFAQRRRDYEEFNAAMAGITGAA